MIKVITKKSGDQQDTINKDLLLVQNDDLNKEIIKQLYSKWKKVIYVFTIGLFVIGIFILLNQIWTYINFTQRILSTLVLGLLVTGLGSILLKTNTATYLGRAYHVVGSLLVFIGSFVIPNEIYDSAAKQGSVGPLVLYTYIIIFMSLSVFYFVLNYIQRSAWIAFLAIAYTTLSLYFILRIPFIVYGAVIEINPYFATGILVTYLLLAYHFFQIIKTKNPNLDSI